MTRISTAFLFAPGMGGVGGNHIKLSQRSRLEQSVRKYYRYYAFKKGHWRYLEVIAISLDLHPVIYIYYFFVIL